MADVTSSDRSCLAPSDATQISSRRRRAVSCAGDDSVTSAAIARQLSFAGAPASAWAFGIRIWSAVVVALAASFWLELEAPSTAALTVAILAAPTRGEALDKAGYRLIATMIGVMAALAITGLFSQARDLLIAAFAGWIGLGVYAAGLVDGNRAYAAVLSGYTVAFVAMQQMDTPDHVFETGMARGAGIAVGIVAVALVNDLLAAPDTFPRLASQLAAFHRRVRDYARPVLRDETSDAATAAALFRDIVALRPDMASLVPEAASGSIRSAAARCVAVALVAEVYAARALNALPEMGDPAFRARMAATLDWSGERAPASVREGGDNADRPLSVPLAWASRELLRRDAEVREGLAALNAGKRPQRTSRAPLYRSRRIAAAAGIRAAACLALPSAFFVLAGWPAADVSLSLVAVVIGLGATTPDPKGFTFLAFIGAPIAILLAGVLEFLILDGVNEFALLALALAPFVIGATVLMTRPNRLAAGLGRINLIFILAIFAPTNPPAYNPQSWLFTSLFVWVCTALLLAAQILVPTESNDRRQRWIMASVRRDFELALSKRDRRLAPEEAMFRDAARIGQIPASGASHRDRAILEEALSYFDRAGAIRLGRESLARLVGTSNSHLALEAMVALAVEDTQRLRDVGLGLKDAGGTGNALAQEISGELALVASVIDAAREAAPPAMETARCCTRFASWCSATWLSPRSSFMR
jgi:uncharacterized membrane protein YccC